MIERLNVREFRASFSRLTQPVEVLRGTETIGFWYPGPVGPIVTPTEYRETTVKPNTTTPAVTKVEPGTAPRSVSTPQVAQERFNSRPFTPAPKTRKTK